MKLSEVSYMTESPAREYSQGIRKTKTLSDLKEFLKGYEGLVNDAMKDVERMKEKDFDEFKKCLAMESRGVFMGEKNAARFGALLLPSVIIQAEYLADRFGVAWGLAIRRLAEYAEATDE